MKRAACRICDADLRTTFADLGISPLANSYVALDKVRDGETLFPLHAYVCEQCFLVQLEEFESPDKIFSDYAYLSGFSSSWLKHAEAYAHAMARRFDLRSSNEVIEVASNDGYLLQYFKQLGVPVLGIEPARNVAKVAIDKGIPTEIAFFGKETATALREAGHAADLMAANNVLAHVPDILDFVSGFKILLKPDGVATFEFPHLLRMIESNQFDTIYHEHFSYLSLLVVADVLKRNGMRVFDVQELPTHGGSLRVYFCHETGPHDPTERVKRVLEDERAANLANLSGYKDFGKKVVQIKFSALEFLIKVNRDEKIVCGYGAAAKGNTFLNYCGIGPELVKMVADRSPYKQNTLLPGSRIPVVSPEAMLEAKPDYILILPWNLRDEIAEQLKEARNWGAKFVTMVPTLAVF